jgi:hypothetical protein
LRSVKKPFSGEPKKTTKTLSRLGALKGFSEASGILAFEAQRWRLSVPFFAKEERNKKSSLKKKGTSKEHKKVGLWNSSTTRPIYLILYITFLSP